MMNPNNLCGLALAHGNISRWVYTRAGVYTMGKIHTHTDTKRERYVVIW